MGLASDLVQVLDPDDFDVVLEELWSDYDGSNVYGDFVIDNGNPVTERSFAPGLARVNTAMTEGGENTDYYYTDHLGTMRRMTDPNGDITDSAAFTAFGERLTTPIDGPEDRYGYAGAFGYQEHSEFAALHVGTRYYEPSSGRFLQRDAIGIGASRNVYAYMDNAPVVGADTSGQFNDNSMARMRPGPYGGWILEYPPPRGPGVLGIPRIVDEVRTVGTINGKSDSWMHSVATCRIATECGGLMAGPAGVAKEIGDVLRYGDLDLVDHFWDLVADAHGLISGIRRAFSSKTREQMANEVYYAE